MEDNPLVYLRVEVTVFFDRDFNVYRLEWWNALQLWEVYEAGGTKGRIYTSGI